MTKRELRKRIEELERLREGTVDALMRLERRIAALESVPTIVPYILPYSRPSGTGDPWPEPPFRTTC
jgi:hypothetical protein